MLEPFFFFLWHIFLHLSDKKKVSPGQEGRWNLLNRARGSSKSKVLAIDTSKIIVFSSSSMLESYCLHWAAQTFYFFTKNIGCHLYEPNWFQLNTRPQLATMEKDTFLPSNFLFSWEKWFFFFLNILSKATLLLCRWHKLYFRVACDLKGFCLFEIFQSLQRCDDVLWPVCDKLMLLTPSLPGPRAEVKVWLVACMAVRGVCCI